MNTTTCVKILNKTEAALSPYLSVLERLLDDLSKYPMTVIYEKVRLGKNGADYRAKQVARVARIPGGSWGKSTWQDALAC